MDAKPIIHVGIALILLGIVAFSYQGGGASSEKTVEDGSLKTRIDIKQSPAISPFLGGLALIGGIALVVVGVKKSS